MHNHDPYYVINLWMIDELKLSGARLLIYAIIYGFCKDEKSCYHGGLNYLSRLTGLSCITVSNTLKSLVKDNLIVAEEVRSKGCVTYKKYHTNFIVKDSLTQEENEAHVKDSLTYVKDSLTCNESYVKNSLTYVKNSLTNKKHITKIFKNKKYINKKVVFRPVKSKNQSFSEVIEKLKNRRNKMNESFSKKLKNEKIDPPSNSYFTKNKVMQNEKPAVSISNIVNETMLDINNEEARKNKQIKEVKEVEKTIKKRITKAEVQINKAMKTVTQKIKDEKLVQILHKYLESCKEQGREIPVGIRWETILEPLLQENISVEDKIEMVNNSLKSGWRAFYPLKNNQTNNNRPGLHIEQKPNTEDQYTISDLEF